MFDLFSPTCCAEARKCLTPAAKCDRHSFETLGQAAVRVRQPSVGSKRDGPRDGPPASWEHPPRPHAQRARAGARPPNQGHRILPYSPARRQPLPAAQAGNKSALAYRSDIGIPGYTGFIPSWASQPLFTKGDAARARAAPALPVKSSLQRLLSLPQPLTSASGPQAERV